MPQAVNLKDGIQHKFCWSIVRAHFPVWEHVARDGVLYMWWQLLHVSAPGLGNITSFRKPVKWKLELYGFLSNYIRRHLSLLVMFKEWTFRRYTGSRLKCTAFHLQAKRTKNIDDSSRTGVCQITYLWNENVPHNAIHEQKTANRDSPQWHNKRFSNTKVLPKHPVWGKKIFVA